MIAEEYGMKVSELAKLLGADAVSLSDREVKCGFCCDLLSHAMANGKADMAWVTVHTHMNVVAIAVLTGAACVIAADGKQFSADVIQKAREENIALLCSEKSAYEICACMARAGME